jgi:uncharacterized membrane protein
VAQAEGDDLRTWDGRRLAGAGLALCGMVFLLVSPLMSFDIVSVKSTGPVWISASDISGFFTNSVDEVGIGQSNEAMLVFAALAVFPGMLVAVKAARTATTPRSRVLAVTMLPVALVIAIAAVAVVAAQVVGWVNRLQAAYYRSSGVTVAYAAGFWLLFVGPILVLAALLLAERTRLGGTRRRRGARDGENLFSRISHALRLLAEK